MSEDTHFVENVQSRNAFKLSSWVKLGYKCFEEKNCKYIAVENFLIYNHNPSVSLGPGKSLPGMSTRELFLL